MNGDFGNNNDINLTIIGSGMNLTGNLFTLNDVRIDGKFTGDLQAKGKIVVSELGEITGDVKGVNIVIMGKAYGDFEAENNFQVASGGYFKGTVKTRCINISDSAHFEGTCDISPKHKALDLVQPEESFDTEKIERILILQQEESEEQKQPETIKEKAIEKPEEKPEEKPKEALDNTPPPKLSIFASKIREIKSV